MPNILRMLSPAAKEKTGQYLKLTLDYAISGVEALTGSGSNETSSTGMNEIQAEPSKPGMYVTEMILGGIGLSLIMIGIIGNSYSKRQLEQLQASNEDNGSEYDNQSMDGNEDADDIAIDLDDLNHQNPADLNSTSSSYSPLHEQTNSVQLSNSRWSFINKLSKAAIAAGSGLSVGAGISYLISHHRKTP